MLMNPHVSPRPLKWKIRNYGELVKGEFLFARWTLLRDYSPPDIKELGSGSALLVCFRIGRAPDYLDPLVGRIFES
uniref:Pentatricopeptide repeat-containing protein n=1 Tax=Steinernema glaseri TaxID=37863 RepID=A0A1I7YIN1_9BILA